MRTITTEMLCPTVVVLVSPFLLYSLADGQDASNRSDSVLFPCDFESSSWWHEWGRRQRPARTETLAEDAELKFEWEWGGGGFPGLENNRWYRIEQFVKMNTPRINDGVLRAWVDGVLVFEKSDVRMRDVSTLKIETVWIHVHHGGTWTAKADHHLYIGNVVIS